MKTIFRSAIILTLTLATAGLAASMRPTLKIAELTPAFQLAEAIPNLFGNWRVEALGGAVIVDPRQSELLNKIYRQTLSRAYRNQAGNVIMLSIAYGDDQRDSMQMHYPEVCYPAQGFQVLGSTTGKLVLPAGVIPVRRLETRLGSRQEYVTYWAIIGSKAVLGGFDKKLAEMGYGLKGLIPDGLLFRVSSIDDNPERAYRLQEQFVDELFKATSADLQPRLFGLSNSKTAAGSGKSDS